MMGDRNFWDPAGLTRATRRLLRGFLRAEQGAVTVDWVVLTGMIVLLGMAAGFAVTANVPGLAEDVGSYMSDQTIRQD